MTYPDPTDYVRLSHEPEHESQRILRGFSDWDWINADTYLAWVISGICQKKIDDGHTCWHFTGDLEEDIAETERILSKMVKVFGEYAKDSEYTALEELDEALDLFKKYFTRLWD